MINGLKIAVVASVVAIVSAFLIGGRYTAVSGLRAGQGLPFVYVIDRFTGSVHFCLGPKCYQSSFGPQSDAVDLPGSN